jgi:hypothetical protein
MLFLMDFIQGAGPGSDYCAPENVRAAQPRIIKTAGPGTMTPEVPHAPPPAGDRERFTAT